VGFRLGIILGAIIAAVVGAWFIWITATSTGADARFGVLGGAVALCFVIAVVVGWAASISPFFPGLGLGFCPTAALASLVCAAISWGHGWGNVALGYVAMMLTLVACFFIVRVLARRIRARG
jgi:hypothetical protein